MSYDIAIIGAGVSGALIARQLSKYDLKIALIEKENDVAMGSTKANTAIVHAGYDARIGTLKAKLNVKGSKMMSQVCEELNVPYNNLGSLVIAFNEEEDKKIEELYQRGITNGVEGLKIVGKNVLKEMEPCITDEATTALWAPTAAIVCPYELTIAATETAVTNGVEFFRNAKVNSIHKSDDKFTLRTRIGDIDTKYIINAAGLFSGEVAKMIGDDSIEIIPRKGEYYLLDKTARSKVNHALFQCPSNMGKGILVSPTVDGNVLLGPTAETVDDKECTATTIEGLNTARLMAQKTIPTVNVRDSITTFCGLRAHSTNSDFIIEPSKVDNRFINVAGIESPGLSAAPAIAEYVEDILKTIMVDMPVKESYTMTRKAPVRFRHMTTEQRKALVEQNSAYGRIICRCETITEGEIIDAIHAPAGARDIDGVKRRTRAGMGRCQGGFCSSKVLDILARELDLPKTEITKFGRGSKILFEKTK